MLSTLKFKINALLFENDYFKKDATKDSSIFVLYAALVWIVVYSIYFFYTKNPDVYIQDDLLHQVATALNRLDSTNLSKDYLYEKYSTLSYYSPIQIWSIATIFYISNSITFTLLFLSCIYSIFATFCSWYLAREITRNSLLLIIVMVLVSQFVYMPTNAGYSAGFLRLIFPFYFPYNSLIARGLILLFIAILIRSNIKTEITLSLILGLMFTFHAPTGLTLAIGSIPYFLVRAFKLNDIFAPIKWILFFLLTASPFIVNYFVYKNSPLLTDSENYFLYQFWQYRFPDDYPHPLWKLLTRGDTYYKFLPHIFLITISISILISLIKRSLSLSFISTGLLLFYIFGLKSIPLSIGYFLLSYLFIRKKLDNKSWNLMLIIAFSFFTCTWLQWGTDIYYAEVAMPPKFNDNARFLPHLFPLCIAFLVLNIVNIRGQVIIFIAISLLIIPLSFRFFDDFYFKYASDHNITLRASFNSDTKFNISNQDYIKLLSFARNSSKSSLFLYEADYPTPRNFRIDANRSIAMNFGDMALKYYNQQKELAEEWPDYLIVLDAYRSKDLSLICEISKKYGYDYVVFPSSINNNTCFHELIKLDTLSIYIPHKLR